VALNAATSLLKASADPTRLRLLALLEAGEATVGELTEILGQSQPRVSRHLRILADARLVSHFRDGQWVYYRLDPAPPGAQLVERIVALARARDDTIAADQARMNEIRRRRELYAFAAPTGPRRWLEPGSERPSESDLTQALADTLGAGPLGDVLDIGVGSGALLRLLAPRATSAVGLDASRGMRVLARSRLLGEGLAHCTVRSGDMHALPFPDHAFDVVLLDEVLALTEAPLVALGEAVRVLRPAGRLLVLDRLLPPALRLPSRAGRRVLFENQLTAMLRAAGLRSGTPVRFPGRSPEYALIAAGIAPARQRTGTHE
jgi:ArsR family transcriptional regulator